MLSRHAGIKRGAREGEGEGLRGHSARVQVRAKSASGVLGSKRREALESLGSLCPSCVHPVVDARTARNINRQQQRGAQSTHTNLLFLRLDLMAEATSADATGAEGEGLAEALSTLRPAPPGLGLAPPPKESRAPLSDSLAD